MLYQYHPPFTFGFLRHNEVLFHIKEQPQAGTASPGKGKSPKK
jgi:hypothetical protein